MGAIQDWLFKIALQKGVKKAAQAVAAWIVGALAAPAVGSMLETLGVDVTVHPEVLVGGLATVAMGGIEILRNWLKHRFPSLKFL